MEKHYSIGTFSKMTNVTPRTLHYYDEIGLLVAKRTEAGHRYYTKDDLITLQRIVSLKFLGYSLETIQELLTKEKWDTAEYFTFQRKEMIKKRDQLNHSIRLLEHAQNLIEEKGELDPDIFFLLINSVQMEEEHKKWLKEYVPEHLVDQLYEMSEEQQHELEKQFLEIVDRLKSMNLDDPTSEELQQCIDEFFSITKDVINQDLIEFLATMDDVEFTDQDEWLFPAYLFTPEEEEKLGKAVEYYLKNAGDLYGKKN